MLIFIIVLLLYSITRNNAEPECYAEVPSSNATYSWMTAYPDGRINANFTCDDCTLIYIWGLVRHGTRYTCDRDTKKLQTYHTIRDQILSNQEKKRGTLCKADVENLKKWKNIAIDGLNMRLTQQGIADAAFLGANIKKKFLPKSLTPPLKRYFQFQTSDKNRTKETGLIFSNAYLGVNSSTIQENGFTIEDKLLNPEEHCNKHNDETNSKSSQQQIALFKLSSYWKKMTERVNTHLGYQQLLSTDDLTFMYFICAYENAWFPKSRPAFCAAFSKEDLKVLEYYIDLMLYQQRGYGNKYAARLGCILVRDMVSSLSNASGNSSSESKKGKFLFGHSETLLPLTVALGLSKDDLPMTAENYPKLIENRKWKTAYFDGFTGNLMVALYKSPKFSSGDVVVFYQNERPVILPNCSSIFCPLHELKKIFADVFDESKCNLKFC